MQYVKECLQLLYWIYFKPYTLKRYVRGICPEISNPYDDNIYRRSAASRANLRLKRYDNQGWWLTVTVPIFLIFMHILMSEGNARILVKPGILRFDLMLSSYHLLGWVAGQLLSRAMQRKLNERIAWLILVLSLTLIVAPAVLILDKNFIADNLLRGMVLVVVEGVVLSMTVGLAGGAMGGVAVTVTAGVIVRVIALAGGAAVGAVYGALFGTAFSMLVFMKVSAFGVALGVALSMALGVVLGLAGVVGGVTVSPEVGVAFGAFFILGILRVYFWLPELIWSFFLKLSPISQIRRLSLLPPQFDQLIHLPLPFLPGFIAEAYQENQAASRQTIDYLITSTNQQKTATKAISRIAVEECSRCQTVRDIGVIRNQLSWMPNQQSDGLAACLEISQDVTAALEASSPYRQAQQMDKVIQKIDRQRNALATASAREATSFGSALDNWQRILETARRTLREQAKNSDEIPQVYLAGPALDPNKAGPLFKGRCDLFRQIETLTLSSQHPTLIMHGGRRSGKTSTLNYLPKWLPSDILPLLIDGQSLATTSTLSGFVEEFADQIIRSARKVHNLKFPTLESVTPSDDPFVTLRRWIDAVEQAIPDKTLLLCLDEFERLDEILRATDSRAPLNFLRHLIQHRDCWTLLFTGAHTPEELPAYWSDYLINCETLRISYLTDKDCLELIQHPVEDFPDIYPDAVAHAIRNLTGGQPYFTQLLCHELVEQLNRKKAKIVQMDDLETVLPAVFERGYQVFREFWDTLTTAQQNVLLAVAEDKIPSAAIMKAASILVRKEILAQKKNNWFFQVPLLRCWIRQGQGREVEKIARIR